MRHILIAVFLYFFMGTLAAAAVGFKPPVNYGVGTYPDAIAAGDFNQDGKLDLVIANYSDLTLSVMLGNGDGTFNPKVDYADEYGASSVAVGDFNNDGKLDLVLTTQSDTYGSAVDVLLGNGDGTFQPYVAYPTAYGPYSVAVADFNGDGNADLATANYAIPGNTLSVLMGNGDGTFQPHVDYGIGSGSRSIVAADFNADGKPDLAAADTFSSTVSVYLGNGDGTFQLPVQYTCGSQPDTIAVGDFNRDGKRDLATMNEVSTFSILLGNGDGTFQPGVQYATAYGQSLVVADFNGDKKADLAIAHYEFPWTVGVLLGNGDGTFQPEVQYATGAYPNAVGRADLNVDGAYDLMTTNGYLFSRPSDGDTVSVLLNIAGTYLKTTSSANPSKLGQAVTFTTTVKASLKGMGMPTGTVTFVDGESVIGSGTLVNGQASFTTSRLKAGMHAIRTQYSGDSTFNRHTVNAIRQQVVH